MDPEPTRDELFRLVDELLADHPPASTDPVDFLRAQFDRGLAYLHFPVGHGGLGISGKLQVEVDERLEAAGAPPSARRSNAIGGGQIAATIASFGSEEQKRRYLRPLFANEEIWCQLFSEPGSGSDLASLATRAEPDGDEWVVNGQKVWTSDAHRAHRAILLARTDPDVVKHAGLTQFVVDMGDPGVEVRPLRQMSGSAEFNEVFLTDVRIPDSERLGDLGDGWAVSHHTLMNERYNMPRTPARGQGSIAVAVRAWSGRSDKTSPAALALRERLLDVWIRAEVTRLMQARSIAEMEAGRPGPGGSLGKLAFAYLGADISGVALSMLGPEGMLIEGYEPTGAPRGSATGSVQKGFVGSPGGAIAGGTPEIQKNIIGERILGLPREPSADKGVPWSQTLRS